MKESYFFGILPTKKDPPLLLLPSKTISYVYLSLLLVNFHIKKENSPFDTKHDTPLCGYQHTEECCVLDGSRGF